VVVGNDILGDSLLTCSHVGVVTIERMKKINWKRTLEVSNLCAKSQAHPIKTKKRTGDSTNPHAAGSLTQRETKSLLKRQM
jgi:hypothetical protein